MILRRVIGHLRKQEWTAIAIDFVIVVVGVFIGIQVSNWNQARADHVRAHAYLERIRDDLAADRTNYEDRLHFWGTVADYGRTGLDYAETGRAGALSQWQLLLAYFQASQVAEFFITDTTYEELKSAGELDLIADLGLRNALARYYTNSANPVMTERPAYRVHVRGVIPLDVQLYVWRNCYRSTPTGEQQLHDCASPISQARATQVVDAIHRDPALMAELRYWTSNLEVAANIGRDRTQLATELTAAINADLGDGPGR